MPPRQCERATLRHWQISSKTITFPLQRGTRPPLGLDPFDMPQAAYLWALHDTISNGHLATQSGHYPPPSANHKPSRKRKKSHFFTKLNWFQNVEMFVCELIMKIGVFFTYYRNWSQSHCNLITLRSKIKKKSFKFCLYMLLINNMVQFKKLNCSFVITYN